MLDGNPFENLTSTIKKSTTDTNENKRENWTQDDLVHLFKSLNVKDNLWAINRLKSCQYANLRCANFAEHGLS